MAPFKLQTYVAITLLTNFLALSTFTRLAPALHDFHARVQELELVQVLLHRTDQLYTADSPHVIAATVDEEDIWCFSSLQGVGKEGEKSFLLQSAPAKPRHMDARESEVGSDGLCSSLGSTPSIAVTNDPHRVCGRKISFINAVGKGKI